MNIRDICTRVVVTASDDATLQQAANLMRERHVGTLIVVANGAEGTQALGIVSDRDIVVEAVARGLDATQTRIGRLVEGKLAALPASATVDEAITAMKQRGVRRLLVAAPGGAVEGIVSLDDLLDAVAHEVSELARVARAGIEREATERAPLPPAQPLAGIRVPAYSFI